MSYGAVPYLRARTFSQCLFQFNNQEDLYSILKGRDSAT